MKLAEGDLFSILIRCAIAFIKGNNHHRNLEQSLMVLTNIRKKIFFFLEEIQENILE